MIFKKLLYSPTRNLSYVLNDFNWNFVIFDYAAKPRRLLRYTCQ